MIYNNLEVKTENHIALVHLNRPKSLNALNNDLLTDLADFLEHAREDKNIRVIILTGAGEKAFVAGADIIEFANFNAIQGEELSTKWQNKVFDAIENYPKPVIAAINGFALGGGLELAMASHIRIASENARMGLPEVSLGIVPGYGGTQRLANLVGKGWANQLILSAEMITAEKACRIGLVNDVYPKEELLEKAFEIANKIIKNAPNAQEKAIQLVNLHLTKEGFDEEKKAFGSLFNHKNFKEGTTAFVEKRKAEFE